jgi:hypothetical protein
VILGSAPSAIVLVLVVVLVLDGMTFGFAQQ